MSIEKWLKNGVKFDVNFLKENLAWRKDEPVTDNLLRIGATLFVYGFLAWFIYKVVLSWL